MATNNDWNNAIAAAKSAVTLNAGVNAVGVSTDASATTVNVATGGAVKTLQMGSTNTTSSTAIQSGTGNIVYNTGLTIDSSGRMKNTVQPCFLASQTGDQNNVTGDNTNYTVTFTNEIFDQNNNFDGTSTFTAPVAGKYLFNCSLYCSNLLANNSQTCRMAIVAAGTTYTLCGGNLFVIALASGGIVLISGTLIVSLAASNTVTVAIRMNGAGATKNINLLGSTAIGSVCPLFSGYQIC
jgi:hypothetical protein